jgi:hypothetical protein
MWRALWSFKIETMLRRVSGAGLAGFGTALGAARRFLKSGRWRYRRSAYQVEWVSKGGLWPLADRTPISI